MKQDGIVEVINSICKFREGMIIVESNKIKIVQLWYNRSSVDLFLAKITPMICREIKVNHYIWVRYLDTAGQEIEDRIPIFPPHRAPAIKNIGESNIYTNEKTY